ncbi:hypothetical protein [Trujillonella humicola]|uniref:hypothetical protein n=1 Tax=Trujillonella humicola TaxID=3383699 RepID=UPI0039058F53
MRVRALALAGLSALLLSACGATVVDGQASPAARVSSAAPAAAELPGPELADAAADALEAAGSVRVQGSMGMHGSKADLDMRLQGGDVDASMVVDGQSMRILMSRGTLYLQAAASFWEQQGLPDPLIDAMAGTWVRTPPDPLLGAEEMTLAVLAAEIRSPTGATIAEEVTTGELDGKPVWLVASSDGSVLAIAAEGTPYPLETSTPVMGSVRLSAFGGVEPIVPPADFLDLGDLGD